MYIIQRRIYYNVITLNPGDQINIDGGTPTSNYNEIPIVDGGTV